MTVLIVVLAVVFLAGAAVGFVGWCLCRAASISDEMAEYQRRERER